MILTSLWSIPILCRRLVLILSVMLIHFFRFGFLDCVIVQAVLEHVIQPFVCVGEIERVLCDGGYIYCETPGFQQVHGRQYDFHRFTFFFVIDLCFAHLKKSGSGVKRA